MLDEHKNDPLPSALVFVNSFDFEKDDIEDLMNEKKIYAEVFEIDRMLKDERVEYLNCFSSLYGSKQMPLIFIKDKYIGGLAELQKEFH
jgi:glutaredoxin